jgi:uncharacterized protein
MNRLIIIFVKNLQPGKVKTRLAADVGDEKALAIYRQLISITKEAALPVDADKEVWYSEYMEENDVFDADQFRKKVQSGENLGSRMANSIRNGFEDGYREVVIIGSDCPELGADTLEKAFKELGAHDAVVGPSRDGGYYLLGLRNYTDELFRDMYWSTESVLSETLKRLERLGYSWKKLPELNDIDTVEDLKKSILAHAI